MRLAVLSAFVASAAIGVVIGGYAWRRPRVRGARLFAIYVAIEAAMTLLYLLELIAPGLESKLALDAAQWIGPVAAPILLVAFAMAFTGYRLAKPARVWAVLSALPAVFLALVVTDPLHGWVYLDPTLVEVGPLEVLEYGFGTPIVLFMAYGYTLFAACLYLLFATALGAHRLFRAQVSIIVAGLLVPVLFSALTPTDLRIAGLRDLTPFTLVAQNLLIAYGLFRFRLFDVVPIARDAVIESLRDAMFVVDGPGRVVDLNPAAISLFSADPTRDIGRAASEVLPPWVLEDAPGSEQVEGRVGERLVEVDRVPLERDGQRMATVLVARDITARRKVEEELAHNREHLEELVATRTRALQRSYDKLRDQAAARDTLEAQLLHSQKLEAVGRLAGGVAHDFNNLLTGILGFSEMLHDQVPDESQGALEEIRTAALRAATLTRQLLVFSRREVVDPVPMNLDDVVCDMARLLDRVLGDDIQLEVRCAGDLPAVLADPGQLEQVLMNLAVNARDALPSGGHLCVTTTSSAGGVHLVVEDDGVGMDEDTRQRAFEPFFTTKVVGEGSGLGLSTIYGITHQAGGSVALASAPGEGTKVTITLPTVDAVPRRLRLPAEGEATLGQGTILLVEDDAMVRRISHRALERSGYQVLQAADVQEALALYEASPEVDLVVTDVLMPGGSGVELAEALWAGRPDLPVLFVSGHAWEALTGRGVTTGREAFLQKPFSMAALALRVGELLDEARGRAQPRG